MKYYLPVFFLLISSFSYSQKYVLIDKKMMLPLSYTNTVTLEHSYKNLFAVEKENLKPFIIEVEKIAAMLIDKNKLLPETIKLDVGKTKIIGFKISGRKGDRFNIVTTTDCDGIKSVMHLSDSEMNNARNAYYINTWIKYIKTYTK